MITLSSSLLRAQRSRTILGKHLLLRCVFTYGSTTHTYTTTKIKELSATRQTFSQKAQVLLDDTDKTLHSLDLEGYKAIISRGLITRLGEEWVALPPLWVVGQDRDSYPEKLECGFELEGILDRMGRHRADASYTPESGDTRTVKDWLREIITLEDSGSETEVTQTTVDTDMPLHSGVRYFAGQRLTISSKRVTKLAFYLRKVGSPSGAITFYIDDAVTGSELGSKVLGDAFNLGTAYSWQEVTFDTPINIGEYTDDPPNIRIHCEFINGNASNYVDFAYNATSVVASESLTERYTGDWLDQATYDAGYKYSYSTTPVTVFDDYPAYGLVFDSEDDLIDTFIPADSFRIGLNETRLQKVKELLRYTDCIAVPQNDGLIHIINPTTSGTTYDNEYSLVYGRDFHNFFSKRFRRRIVSPNYIIFRNHPSHSDSYSGIAKDASADLDEGSGSGSMRESVTKYVRATGNAQCTNLATAYLLKLQIAADKGFGVLPFPHFGQEVGDYVNFVDARAGDNRAGNVGVLSEHYKPGQYNMSLGFGRSAVAVAALRGLTSASPERLTAQDLVPKIKELREWFEQLLDIVTKLDDEAVKFDEDVFGKFLDIQEDAYFRKLTTSEELNIPSEAA